MIPERLSRWRSAGRRLVRGRPVLEAVASGAMALGRALVAGFYRVALSPFGRVRRRADAAVQAEIEARTDAYNEAAEDYFRDFHDPGFLRNKPFSEADGFADRLFNLGVLFRGARLRPGDVVLDFGAGSCWMSHFLHRYGCKTYSVDVSETALALGRRLFEEDSNTDWALEPEFVLYDGHSIPLPDDCCDKILVNDAFHHVPNQRRILTEFARLLRPDGIVAMREPGQEHTANPETVEEAKLGVLENDIFVEDLALLAAECGLAGATLIPASADALIEIDAADLGPFMRGKGFPHYWWTLCRTLEHGHFLFLRPSRVPTTRAPRLLSAEIWVLGSSTLHARPGEALPVRVAVRNCGDTTWLGADSHGTPGWTRLGVHLEGAGRSDYDWLRAELPRDMPPLDRVELELELPPLERPGDYRVSFEMVIEGRQWFATPGEDLFEVSLVVGE